ncbi:MAG: GGDEF domain-containing protein [Eubacteriales bacterium]|nr:GGDEF domain-containing protein [Eubacteriales bacterium]
MKTQIDSYLSDFMNEMLEHDDNYKEAIPPLLEQVRSTYHLDVVCITEPVNTASFYYLYVAYSQPTYNLTGQVVQLPPSQFEVALHMYDNSLLCINNEYDKKGAFPTPYNMHYGCVRGLNREFDGAICFMSFSPKEWSKEEQAALIKLGRLYRLILNMYIAKNINLDLYEERRQKEVMLLKAEHEHIRANEQEYRAEHDALTGIFNRAAFERITNSLRSNPHPLAFVILDIDNFKDVNDTYGHDVGDIILKKVAHTLNTNFRDSDVVFRFGGDEFTLILTNYKEDQKEFIVKKIKEINHRLSHLEADSSHCENACDTARELPPVSVSAGAAFSSGGYSDILFKQADSALYQIKKTTKGLCKIYGADSETPQHPGDSTPNGRS